MEQTRGVFVLHASFVYWQMKELAYLSLLFVWNRTGASSLASQIGEWALCLFVLTDGPYASGLFAYLGLHYQVALLSLSHSSSLPFVRLPWVSAERISSVRVRVRSLRRFNSGSCERVHTDCPRRQSGEYASFTAFILLGSIPYCFVGRTRPLMRGN